MNPSISIVICFRDWGLDRLRAAVDSHFENARITGIAIEVIVSDYGSSDALSVPEALVGSGARVVRTESGGRPWNRSAALNAGICAASGQWIVTTDADIVLTPGTMPALLKCGVRNLNALYLIQCRDLPEAYGAEMIAQLLGSGNWKDGVAEALEVSQIRPRWGMGGFAAFTADLFSSVNGYEERMQIWGGEDNDFALRSRRAGFPVRWLSKADVGILHIWHEPSQKKAIQTQEGSDAVAENRRILREDATQVRNLPAVRAVAGSNPLVSIIIPTYKRVELLKEAIDSCLEQTFSNWELLVIENGESDVAKETVASYTDTRIAYAKIEKPGAAAARNHGLDICRGRYVVIHDDDDVMVPTRIQDHLAALKQGDHGTYSGWIDFDGNTLDVIEAHPGKEFFVEAVLCNGKVLTHGSLMLDRSVFKRFRYEEALTAGIDYGFLLLLSRNGLKLSHTGNYGILRRFHGGNMTQVDSGNQKGAALRMAALVKDEYPADTYKQVRQKGISANLMSCENYEDAMHKLEGLRHNRTKAQLVVDARTIGSTLQDVLSRKGELDRMLTDAVRDKKSISLDLEGMTAPASIYVKLRVAMARVPI